MRFSKYLVGSLAFAIAIVSLAGLAAADTETLSPGETVTKHYGGSVGDWVTYSWTASGTLHFTVTDPDEVVTEDVSMISWGGIIIVDESGDYVFEWENAGSSSVTLDYTVSGFQEVEDAWDTFILVAVIGTIVVIAIVVLLVVLLLMKGKKKAPQAPAAPVGPPVMDGKCTRCGSPVEPGVAFCPKCGAPLR